MDSYSYSDSSSWDDDYSYSSSWDDWDDDYSYSSSWDDWDDDYSSSSSWDDWDDDYSYSSSWDDWDDDYSSSSSWDDWDDGYSYSSSWDDWDDDYSYSSSWDDWDDDYSSSSSWDDWDDDYSSSSSWDDWDDDYSSSSWWDDDWESDDSSSSSWDDWDDNYSYSSSWDDWDDDYSSSSSWDDWDDDYSSSSWWDDDWESDDSYGSSWDDWDDSSSYYSYEDAVDRGEEYGSYWNGWDDYGYNSSTLSSSAFESLSSQGQYNAIWWNPYDEFDSPSGPLPGYTNHDTPNNGYGWGSSSSGSGGNYGSDTDGGFDFYDYVGSSWDATTGPDALGETFAGGGNFTNPVALDLNSDGIIGVTGATGSIDKDPAAELGRTVYFDIDANGTLDVIEWYDGSGDGILIDNRDGLAATDMDGDRLFGDLGGKYEHGYIRMELFDTNGDAELSGKELDGLELWLDDGDALVQDGEIQTLAEHGIVEISTEMTLTNDDEGRAHMESTATRTDGSTLMTEDVWFVKVGELPDLSALIADEGALDMLLGASAPQPGAQAQASMVDGQGDAAELLRKVLAAHAAGEITLS